MNKNDKFHGAETAANAQAVSDDELDSVAGGRALPGVGEAPFCPTCRKYVKPNEIEEHNANCSNKL